MIGNWRSLSGKTELEVASALADLGKMLAADESEAAGAFMKVAEAVCVKRLTIEGRAAFLVYDQYMIGLTDRGWTVLPTDQR